MSLGRLTHVSVRNFGGSGGLRTKRCGVAAYAASSTPGALLVGDGGGAVVDVSGYMSPSPVCRCSSLYQGKKAWQCTRAASIESNRPGKSGRYFRVLNCDSELFQIRNNSESLFKTLKYGPEFPERFGSLWEARQFMGAFADWYNHEHRHTGIGLHTAADVHFGLATEKAADRRNVLTDARARHPHRFGTTSAPKILDLPHTVWINRPAQDTTQETDTTAA